MSDFPYLGFGLGLRTKHYQYILDNLPPVDWFEILSENYMVPGGLPLYYLDQICEHYPVVMHGVSLSIGSTDPIDKVYLKKLKELADRVRPKWISDHLCWTGLAGVNLHDLLPLPYTKEAIRHIVSRVKRVQDFLERSILLENVSSYLTYKDSVVPEWEFLSEIAEKANCYILLDVNNIYVSAFNHDFSATDYLNAIPVDRVKQFHLAGHQNNETHIIDTHSEPVIEGVWKLYEEAVRRFGRVSTMIERDDNIPEFPELFDELGQAKKIAESIFQG